MSDNQSINLGDDNFVRSVIHRQVGKLIAKSDFTQQDRNDLVQEVYVGRPRAFAYTIHPLAISTRTSAPWCNATWPTSFAIAPLLSVRLPPCQSEQERPW